MNVRNLALRLAIFGGILGAGALAATSPAFAASATQSTTLTLTIATSITMTGLAATYGVTGPAGTTVTIHSGPLTITTNNALGYNLTLQAQGPFFQGLVGANRFGVAADTMSVPVCPSGAVCSTHPLNTIAQLMVNNPAASAGDVFTVDHAIDIPAGQAPDAYSVGVTYLATTN